MSVTQDEILIKVGHPALYNIHIKGNKRIQVVCLRNFEVLSSKVFGIFLNHSESNGIFFDMEACPDLNTFLKVTEKCRFLLFILKTTIFSKFGMSTASQLYFLTLRKYLILLCPKGAKFL